MERPAGAQLQPVLSQTAGKMVLLVSRRPRRSFAFAESGFLGSTGYHSGRNAQMDVRAAELSVSTGQLLKTIQVSQYTLDVNAGDIRQVTGGATQPAPPNAKAYSRGYMLQSQGGRISFMGDQDNLAPSGAVALLDSPPRFRHQRGRAGGEIPGKLGRRQS